MGLHIDNISKYEASRIARWIKENYPKAAMQFIERDGSISEVK